MRSSTHTLRTRRSGIGYPRRLRRAVVALSGSLEPRSRPRRESCLAHRSSGPLRSHPRKAASDDARRPAPPVRSWIGRHAPDPVGRDLPPRTGPACRPDLFAGLGDGEPYLQPQAHCPADATGRSRRGGPVPETPQNRRRHVNPHGSAAENSYEHSPGATRIEPVHLPHPTVLP